MPRVVIDPALPETEALDTKIARLRGLDVGELRERWHTLFRRRAPLHLPRHAQNGQAFRPLHPHYIGESLNGNENPIMSAVSNGRRHGSWRPADAT